MNDHLAPECRPEVPADLCAALDRLIRPGRRQVLGLVGPPGAGKSTLAAALHRARPGQTVVVPMDGFHLAQASLQALGRAGRKGAPDTFDAEGYVQLLRRLQTPVAGEVVWAPEFRREIEEPVAGAIAVPADVPLVITEGNYLLLSDGSWANVRPLLDAAWYVAGDDAVRTERLVRRHQQYGRSEAEARAWVAGSDEPNAQRVAASRHRADRVVAWG